MLTFFSQLRKSVTFIIKRYVTYFTATKEKQPQKKLKACFLRFKYITEIEVSVSHSLLYVKGILPMCLNKVELKNERKRSSTQISNDN